jgi:hypothetical protein
MLAGPPISAGSAEGSSTERGPSSSTYSTNPRPRTDSKFAGVSIRFEPRVRATRFRIAAPFAQKSLSILLDTHVREEHDHLEVSPFAARLPLSTPRAVSLTPKLRIERQEGSTSSARFSPPARGLTFCPTYGTARQGPQRFQAAILEPDALHARTVFVFLKKENTPCQKITKLSSVV